MKKTQFIEVLLFLLLISPNAKALVCPPKDNAPLCPENGITLLDDTYPTQAFVISDLPQISSTEGRATAQTLINKIIKNYDYEDIPQIMLTIEYASDFTDFKDNTKEELIKNKVSPEKIEKIMSQFTHIPMNNYPWQQDWFESFIDPQNGSPVIRQMASYGRIEDDAGERLKKGGNSCNIDTGVPLKEHYNFYSGVNRNANRSIPGGEMGGNVEGAPGGFCMIGDNLGKSVAMQICDEEDNIIQLQTSWLLVGHVDEIFKIIPTQFNDGRPSECEFSLLSASPKKALELMKDPIQGLKPFSEFNNPDLDPDEMRDTRTDKTEVGNFFLCQYVEEVIRNRPLPTQSSPAVRSVLMKLLFFNEALADEASMQKFLKSITDDSQKMALFQRSCTQNFDKVTNFEMQAVMLTDSKFMKLNSTIDKSLQKDRELIKSKILSRLPQCTKWFNEIEVPNLFYGDSPVEKENGKLELSRPGFSGSFLPNPTNSVVMNKTILFPDTGNNLFNNYLSEEITKRKMKSDFIPTWDYSHVGNGNIHCVSHSLTHCRPNIQGKK